MDRMMAAFSDSLSVDASQLPIQGRMHIHPVNPVHPVFCLWRLSHCRPVIVAALPLLTLCASRLIRPDPLPVPLRGRQVLDFHCC